MLEGFESLFSAEDAPDPQQLADAIVDLAEARAGLHPLRKVVGADFGLMELN